MPPEKRVPVRTPGSLYFVRQECIEPFWQVVQIPEAQGLLMRERGETVYNSAAQAHAVVRQLIKRGKACAKQ